MNKGNAVIPEQSIPSGPLYWGKYKKVKGVMKKVWIGPMTREEMLERDDAYRHMCAKQKPSDAQVNHE